MLVYFLFFYLLTIDAVICTRYSASGIHYLINLPSSILHTTAHPRCSLKLASVNGPATPFILQETKQKKNYFIFSVRHIDFVAGDLWKKKYYTLGGYDISMLSIYDGQVLLKIVNISSISSLMCALLNFLKTLLYCPWLIKMCCAKKFYFIFCLNKNITQMCVYVYKIVKSIAILVE
jgi:hypothetical protein